MEKIGGKGPVGRLKPRWVDNIKIELRVGCGPVDGSCEPDNKSSFAVKFCEIVE
jgi:hypothetical protein